MLARFGAIAIFLFGTGCIFHLDGADIDPDWAQGEPSEVRKLNKQRLQAVELGMSLEQVHEAMGTDPVWLGDAGWVPNPYRTESFRDSNGDRLDVLYYYTHLTKRDDLVTDDELTPIVLRQGAVDGWGWPYLERM